MPFERRYDVLIAGAGVAGIAAALECARSGVRTALIEKSVLPGGLATSGLIYVYLPLCDGFGRQVTFGIAEELLHLSIRYGPGDIPDWRKTRGGAEHERYRVIFSPASFTLALDEALVEAGVELWLDTLIVDAFMKGDRIGGLDIETKQGRGRLLADVVIDATGDADVASRAGVECVQGKNWLAMWGLMADMDSARKAVESGNGTPLLHMLYLGGYADGRGAKSEQRFAGLRAEDITRFVLDSRRLLLDEVKSRLAEGIDRHDLYPLALPAMPQYRTIRRIVGRATMGENRSQANPLSPGSSGGEGQGGGPNRRGSSLTPPSPGGRGNETTRADDSIGMASDWRRSGPVYEVPFGALVPRGVRGLLAAGRCISAQGDAWEVMRVIPPAALTGQAAGAAATLAREKKTTPDALDVKHIQERMRKREVLLHVEDL